MSFLGGIFTGSNPTLTGDENQAGGVAGFGTSVGEGDIDAASGFDETLLSGNQSAQAKLLAPQISTIQKQGQQQNQTAAQFGNRSGGTNAGVQSNIDTQRANVSDMISKLTGQAATGAATLGTSTLGLGLNANEIQEQDSQQALKNQQGSLLGGAITGAADAGLDYLTGDIAGAGSQSPSQAPQPWAPPNYLQQTGNNLGLATDDELGDVSF
jgi:hypothetical protein